MANGKRRKTFPVPNPGLDADNVNPEDRDNNAKNIKDGPDHQPATSNSSASRRKSAETNTSSVPDIIPRHTRRHHQGPLFSLYQWEAAGHQEESLPDTEVSIDNQTAENPRVNLSSTGSASDSIQSTGMASRNRPRGGQQRDSSLDAHEETNMWTKVLQDIARAKAVNDKQDELTKQIIEMEAAMKKKSSPTVAEHDALSNLYREVLRLTEEEHRILHEEPYDVIKNLEILTALRKASEGDSQSRQTQPSKPRIQKKRHDDDAVASIDSPAPTPGAVPDKVNRIKGSSGRSQSMSREPREMSVRAGEDAKNDPFTVGAEVVFKHDKLKNADGEGFLCIIKAIVEGNKRIYDVKDPDPDPDEKDVVYRVKAEQLLPIPREGASLPNFPVGKQVLARYPDTTTFYKAEVMAVKKDVYRLRFEGEEDDKEMEVDRRFVLHDR